MKFNTAITPEDKAIMRRCRVVGRNGIQQDDTRDYRAMLTREDQRDFVRRNWDRPYTPAQLLRERMDAEDEAEYEADLARRQREHDAWLDSLEDEKEDRA